MERTIYELVIRKTRLTGRTEVRFEPYIATNAVVVPEFMPEISVIQEKRTELRALDQLFYKAQQDISTKIINGQAFEVKEVVGDNK